MLFMVSLTIPTTTTHTGKTLTLTSISIKSDREETVTTDYNHLPGNVNLRDEDNELPDTEMVDSEEVHIIIDTGE